MTGEVARGSGITLVRTGMLLQVLRRISSDLTGEDLGRIFEPWLGVRVTLQEVVFMVPAKGHDPAMILLLRVLDRGGSLGVIQDSTEIVLCLDRDVEDGELELLAGIVAS